MDITTEIAAVQRRIAQITGYRPENDVLPLDAAAGGPNGTFATLVSEALQRAKSEGMSGLPQDGSAAASGPSMVPPQEIEGLVATNAATWQVDPALVKAIIANESGFNARATSSTGAQGLMQLMPGTAAGLGVSNAYDPAQNVWGGTRYIKGLLDRFHGDMRLAVAAYNAGPGAVEKYGGVPPYAETKNYVGAVLDSYEKYKAK